MNARGRTSLDAERSEASKPNANPNTLASGAERAVRTAKVTPCPNALIPFYAWSLGTDRAYEVACGSWSCSYCARKKRAAVRVIVADGCEAAFRRGERVRFMTLTDGTAGAMNTRDVYEAWNRLRASLRKLGYLREYAAVLETTEAGALHLHALTTGKFIPQKRLSALARQAGFGRITDIRAVRQGEGDGKDDRRACSYVSKQLAGYMTKVKTDALKVKTAERRRPFRCSRGWGLSLADAELLVAQAWAARGETREPDTGPWVLIQRRGDGSLRLRGKALEEEWPEPGGGRPRRRRGQAER